MIQGPNQETHEREWLEFRQGGVTATEIRDLAKGYASDRRRILAEKIGAVRDPIRGNRYIDWGHRREPVIAAHVAERYGIAPCALLFSNDDDHGKMATLDGLTVDGFTGETILSEIKTSKHDLTPGPVVDGVLVMAQVDGRWRAGHFWRTGYYDQMQWQMLVTDAASCLFSWERHDDDWSGWQQYGPQTEAIRSVWILRDDARIAELVAIYDAFQEEVAAARAAIEAGEKVDLEALSPLADEERELAATVLEARVEKAAAEAKLKAAWQRLEEIALERGDDFRAGGDGVRVTLTTSTGTSRKFDEDRARERSPKRFAEYEAWRDRYTIETPTTKRTLNVSAIK